jgi:hypothetical protein
VKGGKIRLDVTLSKTMLEEGKGERIRLHADSTRTILTVGLGQVVTLLWNKGSAEKHTWAELTVEEVRP